MKMPPYDPAYPFVVSHGYVGDDGVDYRTHTQHCCKRAADEQERYLRARGTLNVTVTEQRPAPRRGAGAGWRVAPGAKTPHNCGLSPVADIEDWGRLERECSRDR